MQIRAVARGSLSKIALLHNANSSYAISMQKFCDTKLRFETLNLSVKIIKRLT